MLIQTDKLKGGARRIEVNEQAENFPAIKELLAEGYIAFDAPVTGVLNAALTGKIVEVNGLLETRVTSACSRCLMPVATLLSVDVALCYTDSVEKMAVHSEEEVELSEEDLGLIPYSSQEIDLRPDLEQEIVMALPLQPLCKAGCQGLCPVCGANLNQRQCDCKPPTFHAGLAALKNFKVEKP